MITLDAVRAIFNRKVRWHLAPCLIGAIVASGWLTASVAPQSASAAVPIGGGLFAWGLNAYGQLGDGTTTDHASPEMVTLAQGVSPTAIATGGFSSLAIGSDGHLYAWGYNYSGQLGDGTNIGHDSPEAITLAPGVSPIAVAAGTWHSLAVGSDGRLYAWGDNQTGQLGDGTTINRNSPEAIVLAPGVEPVAISAGNSESFAIGSDGKLYVWGDNAAGQLGDGNTTSRDTAESISLAPGVTTSAIGAEDQSALAIGSNGKLYAWGSNQYGELGDGSTSGRDTPEVVTLGAGVAPASISAGADSSFAIGSNGRLYAWGDNAHGQLGDGTTVECTTPEVITLAPGVVPTAVSAGNQESHAVGSDGRLYAWGDNAYGQLGDGTTVNRLSPEVITLASGVSATAVSAFSLGSLAIGSATPPAETPEAPMAIYLAGIGGITFGGAFWFSRRRSSSHTSVPWSSPPDSQITT